MTDRLRIALEARRREIADALHEAEEELVACRNRCAELEDLIALAKSALDHREVRIEREDLGPVSKVTLHEEMAGILTEYGNKGMRARDLARAVNTRGRYAKRDGSPVEINQIHARVHNNPHLFRREDFKIHLRES